MTRHLLEIDDLTADELAEVLDLAAAESPPRVFEGRGVGLIFEKPSARTRSSTEVAVFQLGGHPLTIRGEEVGLDTREPAGDVARVLAGYHAAIGARVMDHATLVRMAAAVDALGAPVPVFNLLSDSAHPFQAVADLLTIRQVFGATEGVKVAYVGDANNVVRSLSRACALAGAAVSVACPPGYSMAESDIDAVRTLGGRIEVSARPEEAVAGADVVYTDVWTSMGQEAEYEARRQAFEGFCVDARLMSLAAPRAVAMHCLPAHRGEEIAGDVVDGDRSVVWQQAANRLHAARGLLVWLMQSLEQPR